MGQTLTNGIYLPDEGEVRCYDGLASNWTTLDAVVGGYRAHVANENIHITSEERSKWDNGVSQAYVLRYANTSLTALGTVAFSALDNTDNIKIGDKVLDSEGKLFALTAVDAANSTATLSALLIDLSKDSDLSNYYTKTETDNLLSDKANDADVVHKAGNETAAGIKTFSDLQIISYGTQYKGARNAYILPEFSAGYSGLAITTLGFAQTLKIGSFVLDSNNKPTLDTSKAYIQIATGESNSVNTCVLEPRKSTNSSLGTSSNKWNAINGISPGALFLPQDRSVRVDISAYFTNTADGATNRVTSPGDGYIFLALTDVLTVHCVSQNASNLTHYGQTFARPSAGQLYCLFPVRKNDNVAVQWYTNAAAVTVSNAFFIPCKGNI